MKRLVLGGSLFLGRHIFEPLAEEHLAMLAEWFTREHVVAWWDGPRSVAEVFCQRCLVAGEVPPGGAGADSECDVVYTARCCNPQGSEHARCPARPHHLWPSTATLK